MTNEVLTSAGVNPKLALQFGPAYDTLFKATGITEDLEIAHFLAQILHESGMLRYMREIWGPSKDQLKYERDLSKPWNDNQLAFRLGNSQVGDGRRFMGRGGIQTTGRYNYMELSKRTGIDFVNNPEWLEQPQNAVLADIDYWKKRDIGRIALGDDGGLIRMYGSGEKKRDLGANYNTALVYVTAKINPGLRGLKERADLLIKLKKAIASSKTA